MPGTKPGIFVSGSLWGSRRCYTGSAIPVGAGSAREGRAVVHPTDRMHRQRGLRRCYKGTAIPVGAGSAREGRAEV